MDASQMRSSRSPKKVKDSWDLDDGLEYDGAKFYVGSRDREKETVTITVNVPRSIINYIDTKLAGKEVPAYRTRQDFVRDAIFHRMYFLKEWTADERAERILATLMSTQSAANRLQELRDFDENLQTHEEALKVAYELGHWSHFWASMDGAEAAVASWPQCRPRELLAAVVERYRRLAEAASE